MMINGRPAVPSELGVRPSARLSAGFLSQAFLWMFAGLLVTATVAWLVGTNESLMQGAAGLFLPVMLVQFGLVMGISAGIRRMSATLALLLFFVYSATMGVTISLILTAYDLGTAFGAFAAAAVMFGGAAAYGAITRRSLASIGGYLFMALIGIVAASNKIFLISAVKSGKFLRELITYWCRRSSSNCGCRLRWSTCIWSCRSRRSWIREEGCTLG